MKRFLMLALFSCLLSHAQIKFEKGYFIDNAGNKTECFIRNVDWENNPVDFAYKITAESAEVFNKNINDAAEFGIDELTRFKRANIKIERSDTDANHLETTKIPHFKQETLFLKVLVQGDANLYGYSDGTLNKFFFDAKDLATEQLIYIRYLTEGGDAAENNQFRQQLLNGLKNGNVDETDLKKISYDEAELVRLFEKYDHTGKKAVKTFERKTSRKSFAFKVLGGITQSYLELTAPNYSYELVKTDNQIGWKAGLELEYTLPFNSNKWRVFVSPMFSKFKSQSRFYVPDLYFQSTAHNVSAQLNLIEVSIGLRHYFYLGDKSGIIIDAAYVVNNYSNIHVAYDGTAAHYDGLYQNGSINFGLGYNYQKWSAEFSISTLKNFYLGPYLHTYHTAGLILSYQIL